MGKSAPAAPAPDPNIGIAAMKNAETGEQWLSFARDAFAISTERQKEIDSTAKEVADLQLTTGRESLDMARQDRQRYLDKFRPIEDEYVDEALKLGTPERQAEAAATAKADVLAASQERDATQQRQAAALGIDPRSGRYAGIARSNDQQTALASAGAQNTARTAEEMRGIAAKADLVNMGRGLPTQAAAGMGQGAALLSSAANTKNAANAQFLASTGMMDRGFAGQMQGYSNQGNILQNQFETQSANWRAETAASAQSAAGIGSALGGLFGLFLSDEDEKTDRKKTADGEGIKAVRKMPVEKWKYKPEHGDPDEHIGPMAQEFQKATGRGDGKSISVVDALGVTMKAVQDVDKRIDRVTGMVEDIARSAGATTSKTRKKAKERAA